MSEAVAIENRSDEVDPNANSNDESGSEPIEHVTRSGRVSKPHDYAEKFPETAHLQIDQVEGDERDGKWMKPYYYDSPDVIGKLGKGTCYKDSYFLRK